MAKTIFRKIGGRIIPIKIASSANASLESMVQSSKLKNLLKSKIAAKTSLSEQRISAIRSVRESLSKFKKKEIFGFGQNMKSTLVNNKIVKTGLDSSFDDFDPKAIAKDFNNKVNFDIFLSRKKITPQTFVVSTSKNKYLVQDVGQKVVDVKEPWSKPNNPIVKVSRKADNLGVLARDVFFGGNSMKFGKKVKFIDSGHFDLKSFSDPVKLQGAYPDRFKKFLINYKKSR